MTMLSGTSLKSRLGWRPDIPDHRDYNMSHVEHLLHKTDVNITERTPSLPSKVNLSQYCSPIENQGNLGSCTANAGVALLEYFQNRVHGKFIDGSRLFLYKVTRKLAGIKGDGGAHIRNTIGAMRLFGVPPEEYYPYDIEKFDQDPEAFCYAFAENYKAMSYFRIHGDTKEELLSRIKHCLASGLPSEFGFTVFNSIALASETAVIPFPTRKDKLIGGHAVVAVGYDDNLDTGNDKKGAIMIRNSWGDKWGDNGYGYLPYDYILYGLATDWWSILQQEWVDTGQFTFQE
ncbi:C1 family peptidase [Candidatus Sororendozoicomonas aggregata]|uniref:C1 family peptidase n=1 Tax=Candidatus Sororendozoicomonas aggregata TaxID=3073239 RepID=UPI002ED1CD3B